MKGLVNTEFMLENRLDAIASDQGANFVAAIRKLIEEGVSEEQVRILLPQVATIHQKFLRGMST